MARLVSITPCSCRHQRLLRGHSSELAFPGASLVSRKWTTAKFSKTKETYQEVVEISKV